MLSVASVMDMIVRTTSATGGPSLTPDDVLPWAELFDQYGAFLILTIVLGFFAAFIFILLITSKLKPASATKAYERIIDALTKENSDLQQDLRKEKETNRKNQEDAYAVQDKLTNRIVELALSAGNSQPPSGPNPPEGGS